MLNSGFLKRKLNMQNADNFVEPNIEIINMKENKKDENVSPKVNNVENNEKKKYNIDKEKRHDYYKSFIENNQDKLKKVIKCDICEGQYTYFNKDKHIKTKKHISHLNKTNNDDIKDMLYKLLTDHNNNNAENLDIVNKIKILLTKSKKHLNFIV